MRVELNEKSLLKPGTDSQIVIDNGTVRISDGLAFEKIQKWSIDPSSTPMIARSTFEEGGVVLSAVAAYDVDGDELTVRFNAGRADVMADRVPGDLDSEEGILVVCRRVPFPGQRGDNQDGPTCFENSIGMNLVAIPAGDFLMGSIESAVEDEKRHRVRMERPFFMSAHEVTESQFTHVMGARSGGNLETGRRPTTEVSWWEAVTFCTHLSRLPKEIAAGRRYRLATEAEWEYACRAGTATRFSCGRSLGIKQANVCVGGKGNQADQGRVMAVGDYEPNAFGLFDMHGNVAEWCADWYADYSAEASILIEPQGPLTGTERVVRGGSYQSRPQDCRSACRAGRDPDLRSADIGFRVVCEVGEGKPDFSAIAEFVVEQLDGCVWEFAEVHTQTEHLSRYAAIQLVPIDGEEYCYTVRIWMRVSSAREEEGADWAMRGKCQLGMQTNQEGRFVQLLLRLSIADIRARDFSADKTRTWGKHGNLTKPVQVDLWSAQEPEAYARLLPLMLRRAREMNEKSSEEEGNDQEKQIEANRVGWLGKYEKVEFVRRDVGVQIDWLGGSFEDVWKKSAPRFQ